MMPKPRASQAVAVVARLLLETEAVAVNTENLFQFVSGILAPIYVDNRKLIAFPKARREIVGFFVDILKEDSKVGDFDLVAGVATGGIPWAAWIAQEMDIPMAYVRPEVKDRGKRRLVEGALQVGQKVIIVEDTVSTGSSTVNAVQSVRGAGAVVNHCLAIFSFGAPATLERFHRFDLEPYSLTQLAPVLTAAQSIGYIDHLQAEAIRKWAKETWDSALT